jgi:hypothetical protein
MEGRPSAKYAAARRRISFSISKRRFSRRSCTSPDCSAVVKPSLIPSPMSAWRTQRRTESTDMLNRRRLRRRSDHPPRRATVTTSPTTMVQALLAQVISLSSFLPNHQIGFVFRADLAPDPTVEPSLCGLVTCQHIAQLGRDHGGRCRRNAFVACTGRRRPTTLPRRTREAYVVGCKTARVRKRGSSSGPAALTPKWIKEHPRRNISALD